MIIRYIDDASDSQYDFHLEGEASYKLTRTPAGGTPSPNPAIDLTFTIQIKFSSEQPDDVEARLGELRQFLARCPSGKLVIASQSLRVIHELYVTHASDSIADATRTSHGTVDVTFIGSAPAVVADHGNQFATLTRTGDPEANAVRIDNLSDFRASIATQRPSGSNGSATSRLRTHTSLTFAGIVLHASNKKDPAARLADLQARATAIQTHLEGRSATFVYADLTQVVQIDSLNLIPDETRQRLRIEVQCHYVTFPTGTGYTVEAEVDITQDLESAEIVRSVSGTIHAATEATADAAFAAIIAEHATDGRRLHVDRRSKPQVITRESDELATTTEWLGYTFQLEFRQKKSEIKFFSFNIADRNDAESGKRVQTWGGSIAAADLAEAQSHLATLLTPAFGLVFISGEETATESSDLTGAGYFVNLQFSYTYEGQHSLTLARITYEQLENDSAAENRYSGTVTAPTQAQALALANSFRPAGSPGTDYCLSDTNIRWSTTYREGMDDLFHQLQFGFTTPVPATRTRVRYSVITRRSMQDNSIVTSLRGQITAASQPAADNARNALLAALSLTDDKSMLEREIVNDIERDGTCSLFRGQSFSFVRESPITGLAGYDLLEAEVSLERVGQVEHTAITPIYAGNPIVQPNLGLTIGTVTISGFARAIKLTTARDWGQAKRALAPANGHSDPPSERGRAVYRSYSGTEVRLYEFSFRYSYQYGSNQLTGIWTTQAL